MNLILASECPPNTFANSFRVLVPGDHVLCAVTGEAIPLDRLRYWSVARQEAYASCEISTRRLMGQV